MTVQEFYQQINGDYEGVLQRLMDDERIRKFVKRFPEEKLYEQLNDAIAREDYADAFRCVHSIKGVCMNLGMSVLQKSSSELCEALRDGKKPENLKELYEAVKEDYEHVIRGIGEL